MKQTHAARHAAALSVLRRMGEGPAGTLGNADPARAARALERLHGPLGTFAVDTVLGDVWSRPQLGRRDRSLVVVSALMALKSEYELEYHVKVALNHGMSRAEIGEVLLHVAGYAGFPAAMAASRRVDAAYRSVDNVAKGVRSIAQEGAAKKDDEQRWSDAADVRRTLTGGRSNPDPATDRAAMVATLGPVGEIAYDFAFGEIWSRPEMSRRDRSVVVITILTALAKPDELAFHIPAGLNHGLARGEIEEIMVQMCIYGGIPSAVNGIRAARAAFAKLDRKKKGGPAQL